MFEQTQELVGRGHVGGVIASRIAAGAERGQGVHRRRDVQRFVVAAVHELQQLNGEFHVAQPAGAELDFAGPHPGGYQFLDTTAHRLHLGHEVLALTGRPHHRHQRVDVLCSELGVSGSRSRLQQGLELPGFGPPLVVGDMRLQGAHQLAVFTLGAQRRIDLEERLGGEPHHLTGHPRGDGQVGIGRAVGDEDDVDIADVVQFARTALAHGDHRKPGWVGVIAADRSARDGQRRGQRGVGQVGQVSTNGGERQHRFVLDRRRQIECGQHHQPVAVELPQRLRRRPCVRALFGDLREGGTHFLGGGQRHLAGQQVPGLRVGDDVVAERQRRAEHPEQPAAQATVLDQRAVEFVPAVVRRIGQSNHRPQRDVGVRGARQRPEQLDVGVGVPAQPVQIALGGRFDQPQPAHAGQLGALRRWFGHAHDGSAPAPRYGPPATAKGRPSARTV